MLVGNKTDLAQLRAVSAGSGKVRAHCKGATVGPLLALGTATADHLCTAGWLA